MNFEFSEEQQQLHDTVDRYLTDRYTFEKFRAINASAAGWDKAVWAGLGELGVLALNVPAAQGGLGFGPIKTSSPVVPSGISTVTGSPTTASLCFVASRSTVTSSCFKWCRGSPARSPPLPLPELPEPELPGPDAPALAPPPEIAEAPDAAGLARPARRPAAGGRGASARRGRAAACRATSTGGGGASLE